MMLVRLGERLYEIERKDVTRAREIYAHSTADQNGFESEMEEAGLDFTLELE